MFNNSPSLILATPGCWAREDMGAAFAGVFCGVLVAGRCWLAGTSIGGLDGAMIVSMV